jgi:VWFA-related protein
MLESSSSPTLRGFQVFLIKSLKNRALPFLLLAPGLIVLTGIPGFAQQQPSSQADDVLRINTDLVQTSVTVIDKKGHFVNGLTREQFQLLVDGQPRPITFFERITAGSAREAQLTARNETGPDVSNRVSGPTVRGRTIVFFIDDIHLSLDSLNRTRQLLRNFLDHEMNSGDSVAIVSASGQIGFLQQFTNNSEVLQAAINRLSPRASDARTYGMSNVPMSDFVALLIDNRSDSKENKVMSVYVEECMKQNGPTSRADRRAADAMRMNCEQLVRSNARNVLTQAAVATANTYVALESLMQSSARAPGRKLAFFISDGFLMETGRGPALRDKLDQIIDSAQRAGVVIYTIDARGLTANMLDATNNVVPNSDGRLATVATSEIQATQDALNALAMDTGGRALRNQNFFDRWVDKVLDETSNYYVLAWRPGTEVEKERKFRNVKVSVIGNPDLTVRAPRGYVEGPKASTQLVSTSANEKPPSDKSAKTPESDLRDALADYYPLRYLPTLLSLTFLNTPANGMVLTSSIQLDSSALHYGDDGKQSANVLLAGVILNDKGKITTSFKDGMKVNSLIGGDSDASGIIYNHRAPVGPGIYQVRVAVRDERSGHLGSVSQWIVIPDINKRQLALSSVLLAGQNMGNARSKDGTAQIQLSVDHRFPRSARLSFWVFAYNASGAANLMTGSEVLRDGRVILVSPPHKLSNAGADPERIAFGDDVSLQSLAPGRYDLRVTVTDSASKTTASRTIDFEVQ